MTITVADVEAAAERIAGVAHRTPVLHSRRIDAALGAEVLVKCENLQRAGAFKFRGAYNTLSQLGPEQRRAGVAAFSSGNHAQATALAARLLGIPATIVMPHDAPAAKRAATEGYGATVIGYDRYREDREQITRALAEERGLTVVPPFDDPRIMAGQGTAALELFDEAGELDALYVPLGGGGLLSGSAVVARARSPRCAVVGAEPAAGNDGQRSLAAGRIVRIDTPVTIADGAQTPQLGEHTFEVIRRDVDEIATATDEQLSAAMGTLAETMKIVVEPTGALGFAALTAAAGRHRGQRVGVILSGGNVTLERLAELAGSLNR